MASGQGKGIGGAGKSPGAGTVTPPHAKELYDQAGKLFEENKFQEAIDTYTQAIAEHGSYASAYFNRALSYALMNEYEKATKDAEKVMELEPDAPDAPYVMGVISEYKHDYDSALDWYEKSLKNKSDYTQARDRMQALKEKMKEGTSKMKLGEKSDGSTTVVTQEGQLKQVRWFTSDTTFKDVVGLEKQKGLIHDNIILALTKPELLRAYGKKLGLGVIFFGPPGNGKTLLVRAIAGETKSKFIVANINEVVDMWAGNTEKNMHAIFEQARKNAPCIVFFDEVDAMGAKRESGPGGGGQTMRMAVNQFLHELDGVEKNPEGLFVIGATNQPWDMDPALKRPGRFGEAIYVPPPKYRERRAAFRYNTSSRKMPLARFIDFGRLARATMGFSQADIANICDKAALKVAAEEDRTGRKRPIRMSDFLAIIKNTDPSLDEWYAMVKKEIISKTETQIIEGKKQEIIKEGILTPEEKARYKDMIGDVKKNSSAVQASIKRFMRFWALRLF